MTEFDKKLYRERREKGLRGQIGFANIHMSVKDEKGEDQRIPIGYKKGNFGRNPGKNTAKAVDRSFTKKGFKGHKPGKHLIPATYEQSLTNHQRHIMRRLNRENMKEAVQKMVDQMKTGAAQ